MLSLSKNSKMFRHTVESIHIYVLSHVCHRLKEQSCNPDSLLTQGCSGQEIQTMEKIESNNQGQCWECNSLKT